MWCQGGVRGWVGGWVAGWYEEGGGGPEGLAPLEQKD